MPKLYNKSCSEMDSRKNLMNIINDGIREWGDNRIYYECRNDHDFTGIYKILALPDDIHSKGCKRAWEDLGPAIFRIALALGYDYGNFYDRDREEWGPILKAEHVNDTYMMADCVRHIKVAMKKQRARSHAREIGLTYWPALIDWQGDFDSMALVYAEDYLSRKHGLWGIKDANGVKNTGGWDSHGHHGISMKDVRSYWFAAGCKNTPKFHAQLRMHTLAKKGESVDEFMNYARGRKWLDVHTVHLGSISFSRKAVIALGRIPSHLRGYAVEGLRADNKVVRIRHLNWPLVDKMQKAIARCTEPELSKALACLRINLDVATYEFLSSDYDLIVHGAKECLHRLNAIACGDSCSVVAKSFALRLHKLLKQGRIVEFMDEVYISEELYAVGDDTPLQAVLDMPISMAILYAVVDKKGDTFLDNGIICLQDVIRTVSGITWIKFNASREDCLHYILRLNTEGLQNIAEASCLLDYYQDARHPTIVPDNIGYAKAAAIHPLLGFASVRPYYNEEGLVTDLGVDYDTDLYNQVKALIEVGHMRKAAALPGIPAVYGLSLSLAGKMSVLGVNGVYKFRSFNLKAINALHARDPHANVTDVLNMSNALGMECVKCLNDARDADTGNDVNYFGGSCHSFTNDHAMPSVYDALSQQWNQFFAKNLDLIKYAGHVNSDMKIPKSREAFIAEMAKHRYTNGHLATNELLELSARVNMSQDTFDLYLEAVTEIVTKTYEMLPFIRIDGSKYEDIGHEYILEKLDYNDPTMLSVGLETACCQHLEGVGSRSAEHSYTHPSSAVYVLRKNGSIVAESWVWRNDNDGVVFDSIEGRSSVPDKVVAAAFMELAKQLIGKLCIRKVYVGATTYGFTGEFMSINDINSYRVQTTMIEPCSYMDGRYHYLVVSADKAGEE